VLWAATGRSTVGLDTNVTTGRSPPPHICYGHPVVTLLYCGLVRGNYASNYASYETKSNARRANGYTKLRSNYG
jgi:hypothetical protein